MEIVVHACIACLMLLFFPLQGFAQQTAVDTTQAYAYLRKAEALSIQGKHDSALFYLRNAEQTYRRYAEEIPQKPKWTGVRIHAWERYFEARASIGFNLTRLGRFDSAIAILSQSIVDARKHLSLNHLSVAGMYNNLGVAYKGIGMYEKALAVYDTAMQIRLQFGGEDQVDVPQTLSNMGAIYFLQADYTKAIEVYRKAIELRARRFGLDSPTQVTSYMNIGSVFGAKGDHQQALEYLLKGASILESQPKANQLQLAGIYTNLGNTYQYIGDWVRAFSYYNKAHNIRLTLLGENSPELLSSYIGMAQVHEGLGEYESAINLYNKSLLIVRPNQIKNKIPILANLAKALQNINRNDDADEVYQQCIELGKQFYGANGHPDLANCYVNYANLLRLSKKYQEAIDYNQKAIDQFRHFYKSDHTSIKSGLQNIGDCYAFQAQYSLAREYYQQALAMNQRLLGKYDDNTANCYSTLGSLELTVGHLDQSIAYFDSAWAGYIPRAHLPIDWASRRISTLNCNRGALRAALVLMPHALRLRGKDGDLQKAEAIIELGVQLVDSLRQTYVYENDKLLLSQEANRLYAVGADVALAVAQQPGITRTEQRKARERALHYSEKNKANILAQLLNESNAISHAGIPDSIVEQHRQVKLDIAYYSKAILEQESQCPNCNKAWIAELTDKRFSLQRKYQQFVQQLEQQYPAYYQLKYASTDAQLATTQDILSKHLPQTALVEYLISDTVLYIFCITSDSLHVHRQKIEIDSNTHTNAIAAQVRNLNRALSDFKLGISAPERFTTPARQLYRYLIQPIAPLVKGKDMVVIRDGALFKVPFEVLLSAEVPPQQASATATYALWDKMPYLLKTNAISYQYSAQLFNQHWKNSQIPFKSSGLIAFAPVFSDTATGKITSNIINHNSSLLSVNQERGADSPNRAFTADGNAIHPLPGSAEEVRAIYDLFTLKNLPAKYYIHDKANEAAVRTSNLKSYRYIHFATHGLADENAPERSCLLLAQNSTVKPQATMPFDLPTMSAKDDNLLSAAEFYSMELDADLVVLSACQSGVGRIREGEGIIGLKRGLLYAGARNLLVSQWNVNDASTAELMTKFYSKILAGQSNRQALREAKLELLNSQFACPHYWSAFVLVGR
jgi:CHAT domain-containing protein